MSNSSLYVGAFRAIGAQTGFEKLLLAPHHLVTHGIIMGTTGSGKTGLVTVTVEEALRNQVPVLVIDVKGDLPNLLLSFPDFAGDSLLPWVEGVASPADTRSLEEIAREVAASRKARLSSWGIDASQLPRWYRLLVLQGAQGIAECLPAGVDSTRERELSGTGMCRVFWRNHHGSDLQRLNRYREEWLLRLHG